ncbi:unnamed protein product [Diatraea saccharalis]|uniref:Major facilitator superfamily (MFS) profile domain-containing protein n=1 Tax=Diatraea saccharalis TaxID=40085 RepID=A0A9N9RB39_9NEOP|nr:unnamed protein product [Diatraea saccharalis]
MGFYLGSAVCSGLLVIPNEWFYLKLIASAMAITCSVGAFTIMYTFTSELFPTLTRNMAMGASSTASRVGSMIAPFVVGLNQLPWLPPVVFAVIPLLAAAVCCYLPETKGMKLMDRMENEQ